MSAILKRATFEIDRALEFFTPDELTMQLGHEPGLWPLVLVKELIDNSLDAGEEAGISPTIAVSVKKDSIAVWDNGPGLPASTLERSLNYRIRVSNKTRYVSPTRGQLGNALKCVWAAPFVVDGKSGRVEVIAEGVRHTITVRVDPLRGLPDIRHTTRPFVKSGTLIKIYWPGIASYSESEEDATFYNEVFDLPARYALFNPHATFILKRPGERQMLSSSDAPWRKWLASDPTSPWWYQLDDLRSLIAGYIVEEEAGGAARTVREFVSEFQGLKASAKQKAVTESAGLSRACLRDLVAEDGGISHADALLGAMRKHSRAVKPKALGIIGGDHLRQVMAQQFGIDPECFFYKKVEGIAGDLPFVIETAFAYAVHEERSRVILAGLNFSPVLKMPFPSLQWRLGECRVDSFDPVVFVVHVACPRFKFIERGKGAASIPAAMQSALNECVDAVTKEWKMAKRRADRENRVRRRDLEELRRRQRARELSIKEAAYQVMEQAYLKASAQGTLPANARQIMYAARPLVLELTGGKCWRQSSYFTQHLLPDYMEQHPEKTARWYVVFDARGKLIEPHTQRRTDLGTIEVASYIGGWHKGFGDDAVSIDLSYETCGPDLRYRFALFVEKEGFNQLLQSADIANRFDLAIMSTKGMSVTAARTLVEDLTEKGVTIGVLHDFDKAGFSIVHTLQNDTRRYRFKAKPSVLDLGLRLEDVQAMGLESEPVEYPDKKDPRINLRESGASEAECDFLVRRKTGGGWIGERVELNAMTSEQFLTWLVGKLKAVGVTKVVPDQETLEGAYLRAVRLTKIREAINELSIEGDRVSIPPDLQERVRKAIEGLGKSWDRAIAEIARIRGAKGGHDGAP